MVSGGDEAARDGGAGVVVARWSCGGAPPRLAWPRRRPVVKKMGIGEETRPARIGAAHGILKPPDLICSFSIWPLSFLHFFKSGSSLDPFLSEV